MKLPNISIVTCTYNGERIIEEYLKHLFLQEYPKNKIELILADGGSTDNTIKIIKKYKEKYSETIKLIKNPAKTKIGKNKGADLATKKATGKIIVQLDQDNILIQKDWLKNMTKILIENKEITAVQSKLLASKESSIIDKYLNALGIEDPFAIHYSLNAQTILNPKKFKYKRKGKFYIYTVNKENFYYAGDNGFAIRKKEFLETGGYTQDIDNFSRMANSNKKYKIAIPKNIKLYHKTSTSLRHMLKKRAFYVGHYLLKNLDERDFYWFNLKKNTLNQNLRFFKTITFNLTFIPGLLQGTKMAIKEKKLFWLIHPFAIFSITLAYIYAFFYSIFLKKQKETDI